MVAGFNFCMRNHLRDDDDDVDVCPPPNRVAQNVADFALTTVVCRRRRPSVRNFLVDWPFLGATDVSSKLGMEI